MLTFLNPMRSSKIGLLFLASACLYLNGVTAISCNTCSAGEYYEGCSDSCVSCSPGQYCEGGCADPQPCPAGTYFAHYGASSAACEACPQGFFNNIPGMRNCTACPAGHQCDDAAVVPSICPRGTYSALYATTCKACPAGSYNTAPGSSSCSVCTAGYACPSASADPVRCPIGSYSVNNATECTTCPAGFSCSSTAADSQLLCPDGAYSLDNWAYCVVCPAGHACATTSSLPVECDPGTYSLGGETICRECPDGRYQPSGGAGNCPVCPIGHSCLDKTADPVECGTGTYSLEASDSCEACSFGSYSDAGAEICLACPAGFSCAVDGTPTLCAEGFQSALGQGSCSPCDNGLYSKADRTACLSCEPGFECANPTDGPQSCEPGFYSLGGAILSCTPCPRGSFCSNAADTPQSCAPGTYSGLGNVSCTSCPAGFQCTDPAVIPVVCPTGYYSLGGLSLCRECPAGSECPQKDSAPIACAAPGYYAAAASTSCAMCEAGMHCEDGRSSSPCSVGMYAAEGDGVCQSCPAGSYCPSPEEIYSCPSGTYSLGGTVNCTACPAGYACPTRTDDPARCAWGTFSVGGQSSCTDCPPGSACPSTKTDYVVPCDLGFYPDTFRNACIPCAVGHYCPDPISRAEIVCQDGTYSTGGLGECINCPAGYSCDIYGAAIVQCESGQYSVEGDSTCQNCPAGRYCPSRELNSEIPCKPGTYSLGTQAECTECPPGFACPSTTTNADIVLCINGEFSVGLQTSCSLCPAGYSCPSTESAALYPCSLGEYSPFGDSLCYPCAAGYFCPDPADSPISCPLGFYSESGWSTCTACPAGYECSNPTVGPALCPGGSYSSGAALSCFPCSSGYMCPAGSTNPTPPGTECPIGGYCLTAGTYVNCPQGTYGVTAGGQSEEHACAACVAGYYCPSTGLTEDTIMICPARAYCPAGSSSPTYCPRGSTSLSVGQVGVHVCEPCSRSTYCPNAGSSPISCSSGHYCPTGTYSPIPCPAGTYGDSEGYYTVGQCRNCTVGHYCGSGSTSPTPCNTGTYMPFTGSSLSGCMPCEAGYACPNTGMSYMTTPCAAGYYCASGTITATQSPCPAGTYSDAIDLTSALSCSECPAGHTCDQGTTSNLIENCREGRYCPTGTPTGGDPRCPAGSYTTATDLTAEEDCTPCPAGSYCRGGGHSNRISGDCAAGYFCPVGTPSATSYPCPGGSYSSAVDLYDASQCTPCEPGYFCPEAATEPTSCPEGSYSAVSNTVSADNSIQPSCLACPAGYHCSAATVDPVPCGLGFYSAANSVTCTECPKGYYCASPTTSEEDVFSGTGDWNTAFNLAGMCFNGTICPAKMMRPPDLTRDACPAGFYCPAGARFAMSCPSGTHNSQSGADEMTDCLVTPAGYYSIENATVATGLCSPGHYCPAGSTSSNEAPCPSRYYRLDHGAGAQRECSLCVAGGYCPLGSVSPTVCPKGFYCPTGVLNPEPCRPGTFGNTTGLRDSTECTQCSPGKFCDGYALTQPRGLCDPGYFCLFGSNTSAPRNFYSGVGLPNADECPIGHYCPLGTSTPVPCPAGYYGPITRATSFRDCLGCPPGYFCDSLGQANVTGSCAPGYYCIGFATTKKQNASEPGFYSPSGSSTMLPCLPGTYNNLFHQEGCTPCPAGYYCNDTAMTTYVNNLCPAGSYCPEGSRDFQECSAGTYSAIPGISKQTQCVDCPPGKYCESPGSIAPTGICTAGYYCTLKSRYSAQQNDSATGGPCPAGYYCPRGVSNPIACPKGTYMETTRSTGNVTYAGKKYFCDLCPPGRACPNAGSTAPEGNCASGYFCNLGSMSTTPSCADDYCTNMFGRCPIGSYCPATTPLPVVCPNGTYTPTTGATTCLPCPQGSYCVSSVPAHRPCPQGYYCPEGTSLNWQSCPIGKYGARTGLSEEDECLPCPEGQFCATVALSVPTGNCSAGYYCPLSSIDSYGQTIYSLLHICPAGSYCPSGSGSPKSCPKGTYNPVLGVMSESDCVSCLGGKYCLTPNMTSPSGDCDKGYYCKSGSDTPRPVEEYSNALTGRVIGGHTCEKGAYCPLGSTISLGCPAGTYNDQRGQEECLDCPPGYFCEANSTDFVGFDCPMGHYCVAGTKYSEQYPCPSGTFNNATNGRSENDCIVSPPGYFSEGSGNLNPSGLCDEGYYCPRGAVTSTPHCEVSYCPTGGECYPGVECPKGTGDPKPCRGGMYCSDSSGIVTGGCLQGHYCVQGSHLEAPVDLRSSENVLIGDICPQGHYCPNSSSVPLPCIPGTFSDSFGNIQIGDCLICSQGHYCMGYGTSTPRLCEAGSYCPIGSKTSALLCDEGKFCPAGSSQQTDCSEGTYQSKTGQSSCDFCPAGYYCPRGNVVPIDCPVGSFCTNSTRYHDELLCPSGTFSNRTRLEMASDCYTCSEGSYCEGEGLTRPTGLCDIGYYCTSGSRTRTPDGSGGDVCPAGNYCPQGSPSPVACPPGTNSTAKGIGQKSQCGACTKGYYCPDSGTVHATLSCPTGYYCPGGVDDPASNSSLLCPTGNFCPQGTAFPIPCPAGSYQSRIGQGACLGCPAGYYCLAETSNPFPCPEGHYCLRNTTFPNEYPCPSGYYVNTTKSESLHDCKLCEPGQYCSTSGLAMSEGPCAPGYFCGSGSAFSSPFESGVYELGYVGETCVNLTGGTVNDKCPPGHFCPTGSSSPMPCPRGTNSSAIGLGLEMQCGECTKGYQCPKTGTVRAEILCSAGYFCPGGVANPADIDDLICPTGSRCPMGSDFPIPCDPGTYQDERGNDTCKLCPIGYFCERNSSIPILCPTGYYCPTASNNPREYPCPVGTYNPLPGLRVQEACLKCVEGSYCETPGLSEPTGLCAAGYFCGSGATTRAPLGLIGSDICAQGHYCPEGSVLPTPCPAGTNSTSLGLRRVDECGACTKGYYCPNVGTIRATLLCTGGYYCPGGVADPATNDTLICPAGHQCPEGSNLPLFCESGTYQVRQGQTYCNPCAAGFYCQSALTGAEDCPVGHYCPEGTTYDTEFPCPIGSYNAVTNLKNSSQCTACTPGAYCEAEGQTNITGFCDPGYFCGGGSSVANPFTESAFEISYSGETCISTDLSTMNNMCPPGHYCPGRSAAPIQCPPGTNSSSVGLQRVEDCQPCVKGHYCPLNGTVYSVRECIAGYFCPGGVINPALNASLICTIGSYCPGGSDFPSPCPPGQYQDEVGADACKICPAGFYCGSGTVVPEECPEGHFCPAGTKYDIEFPCVGGTYAPSTGYSNCTLCPEGSYCERTATAHLTCTIGDYCPPGTWVPIHCPNGTYGQLPGLSAVSQCSSCPGGRFCRGGVVAGLCSPGYFCRDGQYDPSPSHDLSAYFAPEDQLQYIEQLEGAQCPPGHYCPENATIPLACQNNTVRLSTHGKSPSDCGPCPGGYICYPGNPVPEPCAAGYYCPEGLSAIPCSLYLYNPLPAQSDPEACIACPAGYYCDDTGLSNFVHLPCPIAHYCTSGTSSPSPCPAGTFRDEVGGASISDCRACPEGHFCPRETSVYYPCPKGTYCPSGSANFTTCPPGHFCPALTGIPPLCPETYYCPIGLGPRDPIQCFRGTYCPTGSAYPTMCPAGSKAVSETNFTLGLLSSLASACEFCEPGTYGDDPARLVCDTCLPGYVCLGNTTTAYPTSIVEHNGFLCPEGYYCPAGSFEAESCPAGTFQPFSGSSNFSACLACAAGFYQNEVSSTACKRCSTSSTSGIRAAQCSCIGQNRAFQASDGWCICEPGYEFVDFNFDVSSDADGSFDCQPVVYDRCVDDEVRTSTGGCDTKAGVCYTRCGEIGGVYSDVTGECECNDVALLDELCDEECRSTSRTVTCLNSGVVAIEDPTGVLDTVYVNPDDYDALGFFSCEEAGSKVYYISTTLGNEFTGIFDSGSAFVGDVARRSLRRGRVNSYFSLTSDHMHATNLSAPSFARINERQGFGNRMLVQNSSSGLISDPVVCINRMDSVVFDVSNTVYPTYVKKSLLNTNPMFDYGAFRQLAEHAASTTLEVSKFAFTFVESGTYVFSLNSPRSDKILIVVVTPDHIICPRYNESQFLESTASNLILLGIKSDDDIVLSPDWNLILGLLVGMFLVVLILIAFLYAFRRRAWSVKSGGAPKYRGKKDDKINNSKGGLFKKNKVAVINDDQDPDKVDLKLKGGDINDLESAMLEYSDDFEDEEPEIGKQLQKHHDELDRHMYIQKDLLNSLQETLVKEVDELKNLLATTTLELNSGTAGSKFKPVDAFIYRLRTELSNRELYERDVTATEAKILQCMESLQKLLKYGAVDMSRNITDQVESSAIEADKHALDSFHRSPDSIQSYTLHSVISELKSIEDFVNNTMLLRVNGEKSRRESAETFFEQALNSSNFELSKKILDGVNRCMHMESTTDSNTNDILTAFTSFSARTPRLVEVLVSTEKGLASKLVDVIGAGNDVAVLHEKEESREVFEIYLQQLSEALELLLGKIDPTLATIRTCREKSYGARQELIEVLEEFRPSFAMSTEKIMPLLHQMRTDKELSTYPMSDAKNELRVDVDADEERGRVEDLLMTPRVLRVSSVSMIERSQSLSVDQKHDLINRFANDVEIMENIIGIEKRRQNDAFIMAMEVQSSVSEKARSADSGGMKSPVHESSAVIARRHAMEKEELDKKLTVARDNALGRLDDKTMSGDLVADVFEVKEKMMVSLVESSFVIRLKQMAFSRKLQYATMTCEFLTEKLSIRLNILGNEVSAGVRRHDKLRKEHAVLSNCEHLQKQVLDASETKMIEQREAILQARSDKKASLLDLDANSLNIDAELESLRNEVDAEFTRLYEEIRHHGERRRDANAIKAQMSTRDADSVASGIRISSASSKNEANVVSELSKRGIELDSDIVDNEVAGLRKELDSLKAEVEWILDIALQYTPPESQDDRIAQLVETIVSCYDHDFNLSCRAERVVSFCDRMVLQCRAMNECDSISSFEEAIGNIKDNTSIKHSGIMQKKADSYHQAKKTEIDRLSRTPYDYDMEVVMLIEKYAGTKIRRTANAEALFRSQLLELLDSLSTYEHDYIEYIFAQLADDTEDLSAYGIMTDLKSSITDMIQSQTNRCERSITAAYLSLAYEMTIAESHSASILNGMGPCLLFAESVLNKSQNSETQLMRLSSASFICMLRSKAEISVHFYFKSEVKRMLALGRGHIDLVNMLSEVKSLVVKSNDIVERLAIRNRDHFEKLLESQCCDKKKFEQEYEAAAAAARSHFANELKSLMQTYHQEREIVSASSNSTYLVDREVYDLGRKVSTDAMKLQHKYRCVLNEVFKAYSLSVETNGRVEDEMRAMVSKENGLQLNFTELSYSCFAMDNLNSLRSTQENRRQQSEHIRKQHQRELEGLIGELDHKKARSVEYLKNRLKLRENLRVQALMAEGVGKLEAVKTAEKEHVAEEKRGLQMIEKRIQEEVSVTEEVSNEDLRNTVKRMKKEAENALQSLQEGFEVYSSRQKSSLEKKLLKRRSKFANDLIKQKGVSESVALKQAEEKFRDEDEGQRVKLQAVMKCFESDIQIKIDEESDDSLKRLKRAQTLERDFFIDLLERKKRDQLSALDEDLETATVQVENDVKSRRLAEIESNHKIQIREYDTHAMEFLEDQIHQLENDKARMHVMLQKGIEEHCKKEMDSIHDALSNRKGVAVNALRADGKSLNDARDEVEMQFADEENRKLETLRHTLERNKRKLTNCVNDIYGDILIAMKTENAKSLKGLQYSLELKKQLMVESLKSRLEAREIDRKGDLIIAGLPDADASRRARLEYGTFSEDQSALEARLNEEMREALLTAEAAKNEAVGEFERFSVEHLVKAEDEEALKKFKQIIGMADTNVENNTVNGGASEVRLSTEAVLSQLDRVISELRQRCDEDVRSIEKKYATLIKDQCGKVIIDYKKQQAARVSELVKGGMSQEQAQRQAYEELHDQEIAAVSHVKDKLEAEMDLEIMTRRREQEKRELKLVEDEFTKASIENNEATELNAEAKKLVEDLRTRYMNELAKARTDLKSAQQNEIDELMGTLAARRAKHENKLAGERADAETRRKEYNRLALKEEEELSILKRRHMEAERVQLLRLEEEYRQQLAAAEAVAKAREQAAAITAMRETALSAERDARARAESDTARREVGRLRSLHAQEDKKLKETVDLQRMKGKEKLDDRLQRKREKREQELKKERAQKVAMLEAKQAAEASEANAAKFSRDVWIKKLHEVSAEADTIGLSGLSRESHIFKILLGEQYVPRYQFDEFMKVVVGPRHTKETSELLQRHYDERITCLKPVISALLDEKNKARIDLIERLGEEKASEADVLKALGELDSKYFAKQQQVEAGAIEKIEPRHVEEQIELRQRQLGEISTATNLYQHQDKKSAKTLVQDVSSQIDAFRAKLTAETLAREEKMQNERIQAEDKLRKSHEERLRSMQEKLEREEETVARGIERMKEDLFSKKAEEEKKQKLNAEAVNKESKARILSAFEKEHEAALKVLENQRQDKKNKLKNRLAARRSSAVATNESDLLGSESKENPDGASSPRRQTFTNGSGNRAEFLLRSVADTTSANDEEGQAKKQWSTSELASPAISKSIQMIEEKLTRIDKVVTMLESNGGLLSSGNSVLALDKNGVFMDPSEPLPGKELVVAADESLSLQELSRLKFGRTIMHMLGMHNYEMKVASSLPDPDVVNLSQTKNSNPFRYSYVHDHIARTIYIHINRVSSSGDIGLIVTHAISHIKVNPLDITSDSDPKFLTEFHTNLRILNQDLYKKLSLAGSTGPGSANLGASLGGSLHAGGAAAFSDRGSPNVHDKLPPSGLNFGDLEKSGDDQFTTPTKRVKHNPHSRSHTELSLLHSLEKARDHIHDRQSMNRGITGNADPGYFTNHALQERIKAYSKSGAGSVVPNDFFNRYQSEGDVSNGQDNGFSIGLQRYDSNSKGSEDEGKHYLKRHRRRHSLGAGSLDKDTINAALGDDSDKYSPSKAEGEMTAEPTPNNAGINRVDSLRNLPSK